MAVESATENASARTAPFAVGRPDRRRILLHCFAPRRAEKAEALPEGTIYGVEDSPPLILTVLAGIQWAGFVNVYLVFLLVVVRAGHVSPPTVAAMVGVSMLTLAAAALLQALPRGAVGSGYLAPAVLSANYLAPSILAVKLGGLPLVFGMTVFAGSCEVALSMFGACLKRLFPTEIQGLVVFLIGIVVGAIGFSFSFFMDTAARAGPSHLAVAALTFTTTVVLSVWGNGALRMLAVLAAMAAGYAASAATGLLTLSDLAKFGSMPVFAFPRLDHIGFAFDARLIIPFAIAALASTAKCIGILGQCQKLNDAAWQSPDMHSIRRGVLADGLGTIIAGFLGTIGINTTPSAVAVPQATGLASRKIAYAAAVIIALLAFLPTISMVLAAMPRPVIGGITLFTGCLVTINGLHTMAAGPVDQRRAVVLGLGIIAGLAAQKYPQLGAAMPPWVTAITSSPLVLGTVVAIIAHLGLPRLPSSRVASAPTGQIK